MVKSITNTKSKIWIAVDFIILGISISLIFFSPLGSILLLLPPILMLYRIKWKSDSIILYDSEIQINNWFTTTKTILELKKIDNYAFNAELIMGERLLLISDNLVVAKIRHENYSNLGDLLHFLDNKLNNGLGGIAQQNV